MRTEDEIIKIYSALEDEFGTLLGNVSTVNEYYDQTVSLGKMPPDIEIYKPPSATEDVNSAVGHIMSLGQTCTVPRYSKSEKEETIRSGLEEFGKAFMAMLDKMFNGYRQRCLKSGVLHGGFISKGPIYIPRIDDGSEDFKKSLEYTFPFHFDCLHPNNVVWVKDELVIESYKRKVIDILKKYPDFKTDKEPLDEVDWMEYWSADQTVYFVDKVPVLNEDFGYGFIPYQVCPAGFGKDSDSNKPEDLFISMIWPALSSYKMEYRTKTAAFANFEYNAYDRLVLNRPLEQNERIASAPGEYSVLGKDTEARNLQAQKNNPDLWGALNVVENDQEKVAPGILHGTGQKYESGYGQASRIKQATMTLLPGLINTWENAMSRNLDNLIHLIKYVVDEPVGIIGNIAKEKSVRTIKPEQLNPLTQHFYVTMDAKTPEEKERRWRLGMESWATGSISLRTLHEDFYDINHDTEFEYMLIEKAFRDPRILSVITEAAMKDHAMSQLLGMIQEGRFNEPKMPPHGVGTRSQQNMGQGEMGQPLDAQGVPQGETIDAYGNSQTGQPSLV